MHEKLKAVLEGMGLKYVAEASARLPQLNSIYVPEVVAGSTDDGANLKDAMVDHTTLERRITWL